MYQIFISYRRNGGEFLEKILREQLTVLGYNVFYDAEELNPERFNAQLPDVIAGCTDFLLLLSPGALDRCNDPDDRVYQELRCALAHNKNIIPIMMQGFTWPESLPAALAGLPAHVSLTADKEQPAILIARLTQKFLCAKPVHAASGTQSATKHYPVTARNRITKTVKLLINFAVKQQMDPHWLHSYTDSVERYAREGKKGTEYLEEAVNSMRKSSRTADKRSMQALEGIHTWILKLTEEQRNELLDFFHAFNSLYTFYDNGSGKVWDYGLQENFSYNGETYEIRDVMEGIKPGEQYLYCVKNAGSLLPQTVWFVIDASGAARPLSTEDHSLAMGLMFNYATGVRLFDPLPLFLVKKLGPALPQYFPQNDDMSGLLQLQKLFQPVISGHMTVKHFLTHVELRFTLGLDGVYEKRADHGSTTAFTPFGKNCPLDIIDATPFITDEPVYFVLTCPQATAKKEGEYFLHDAPQVYRFLESGDRNLSYEEITSPGLLPPGLGERFATRLALYRLTGAIG